jgi:hypothetical protein
MSRFLCASLGLCLGAVVVAAVASDEPAVCIDLRAKANLQTNSMFLDTTSQKGRIGGLPRGKQKFAGIPFLVGESFLQLGGKRKADLPAKIEGIAVGAAAKRLRFLHATQTGTVGDEEVIGKYVVHYDDKTKETIDILYGRDVRDWYRVPEQREVTRGQTVWWGHNDRAAGQGCAVQLFLMTWTNPHPEKRIATIDYVSTFTDAAPFCIAMTADPR